MKCSRCHSENADSSRFCNNCGAELGAEGQAAGAFTKTLDIPLPGVAKDSLIAGKYKIVEEVGRGGMGVVYKAEDLKLRRPVALKFLPPHLMDSAELKERFLVEAQAAAALSHPNICVIHEIGEDKGRSFMAMEYVEGETLRDKLKKGPLSAEETLDIAGQVAAGLSEAHHKGIVHRDVKSANIMITAKGRARVMDFGLAKLRGASALTKTQTTLGTVANMSPEQARGAGVDQRTDIWSLGVVVYEMLTGKLPFGGENDQSVIYAILNRKPEILNKIRPGLPAGLEKVIVQALAKDPANRYQSMDDFLGDLKAVSEGLRPLKARRAGGEIFGLRNILIFSGLAVVLVLFGLNVGGIRDRLLGRAGRSEPAVKLAVLPFANLTGDPEQEYLSDGMTQEMIAELGRLHPQSLSVIARTSVMRYKKTETPIDQIGRELGVEYILEGSARREGSRVRISAELIQVRDQTQLWADTYEREMSGILALQSEVAGQVADALALKLLPAEQARLANVGSVNPAAYEAYLKGTHFRQLLTKDTLKAAEEYFNLALQKDPKYAAAWAGISRVWTARQQMGITPPKDAFPKAKAAALKALELDRSEWEAHRALAGILTWGDWDWPAAERKWDELLEINPNNPEALQTHSHFLMCMGRHEEAIAEIERALELDPYSVRNHSFYATDLLFARRYDDAIDAARTALRLQPDAPVARSALYQAFFLKRLFDEALALDRQQFAEDRGLMEALERGYAEAGYVGAQRRLVDVWTAHFGKAGGVRAWDLALRCIYAGDKDHAIEWLERAYADRDGNTPYIGMPTFDSLRADPRFKALLRRIGLPLDENK